MAKIILYTTFCLNQQCEKGITPETKHTRVSESMFLSAHKTRNSISGYRFAPSRSAKAHKCVLWKLVETLGCLEGDGGKKSRLICNHDKKERRLFFCLSWHIINMFCIGSLQPFPVSHSRINLLTGIRPINLH